MIGEQTGRALSLISGIETCKQTDPGFWVSVATRIVMDLDERGEHESVRMVADMLAGVWGRLEGKREAGTCELVTARLGTPCPEPAVTRLTGTCEHGHVTERLVCEDHRTPGKPLWCRACYRAPDGHECPVVLAPAAGLSDSQRFQVEEARDCLGTWDMANPGGVSRETVLADQVRHLLAIIDQVFPAEARGQVGG